MEKKERVKGTQFHEAWPHNTARKAQAWAFQRDPTATPQSKSLSLEASRSALALSCETNPAQFSGPLWLMTSMTA